MPVAVLLVHVPSLQLLLLLLPPVVVVVVVVVPRLRLQKKKKHCLVGRARESRRQVTIATLTRLVAMLVQEEYRVDCQPGPEPPRLRQGVGHLVLCTP